MAKSANSPDRSYCHVRGFGPPIPKLDIESLADLCVDHRVARFTSTWQSQLLDALLVQQRHRCKTNSWLRAEWKQSEIYREAKFYSLTPASHRQLAVEKDSWVRLFDAVNLILEEGNR